MKYELTWLFTEFEGKPAKQHRAAINLNFFYKKNIVIHALTDTTNHSYFYNCSIAQLYTTCQVDESFKRLFPPAALPSICWGLFHVIFSFYMLSIFVLTNSKLIKSNIRHHRSSQTRELYSWITCFIFQSYKKKMLRKYTYCIHFLPICYCR